METLGRLVVGGHLFIAVLLGGFAVGNYARTGDVVAALPPLVIAVLIVGLGITVARVVERRE